MFIVRKLNFVIYNENKQKAERMFSCRSIPHKKANNCAHNYVDISICTYLNAHAIVHQISAFFRVKTGKFFPFYKMEIMRGFCSWNNG